MTVLGTAWSTFGSGRKGSNIRDHAQVQEHSSSEPRPQLGVPQQKRPAVVDRGRPIPDCIRHRDIFMYRLWISHPVRCEACPEKIVAETATHLWLVYEP